MPAVGGEGPLLSPNNNKPSGNRENNCGKCGELMQSPPNQRQQLLPLQAPEILRAVFPDPPMFHEIPEIQIFLWNLPIVSVSTAYFSKSNTAKSPIAHLRATAGPRATPMPSRHHLLEVGDLHVLQVGTLKTREAAWLSPDPSMSLRSEEIPPSPLQHRLGE